MYEAIFITNPHLSLSFHWKSFVRNSCIFFKSTSRLLLFVSFTTLVNRKFTYVPKQRNTDLKRNMSSQLNTSKSFVIVVVTCEHNLLLESIWVARMSTNVRTVKWVRLSSSEKWCAYVFINAIKFLQFGSICCGWMKLRTSITCRNVRLL